MSVAQPSLWQVDCTNSAWSVSPRTHAECVKRLELLFEQLSAMWKGDVQDDILHKGLYKVRALQPQQDAHISILIPGEPRLVIWQLKKLPPKGKSRDLFGPSVS